MEREQGAEERVSEQRVGEVADNCIAICRLMTQF
jgi:hypothetical protein